MFNYHELDAIDFTKGCYLGQEIVARMQYRGELKRRLHQLFAETEVPAGATITTPDGKSVGSVVTSAGKGASTEMLAVLNEKAETDILHAADTILSKSRSK